MKPRISFRRFILGILLFLVACSAASNEPLKTPSPPTSEVTISAPPPGTLYHAVYPGGVTGEEDDLTLRDLRSYEAAAGKKAAWVYFSNNWYRSRRFPLRTARWIREAGSVPYIRMMLRSSSETDRAEPVFTLPRILRGDFDSDLRAWARSAKAFGTPLIVEFGTEMNGEWFSWNGVWNGAGKRTGYGDPNKPDGPERFRDAYRRIIRLTRAEGADNITWVFHVNGDDWPNVPWNRFENYYPGAAYIDWIGVSIYGAQTPQDDLWVSFREQMDASYPRLKALAAGKPLMLIEFGVTKNHPLGDQAAWARAALSDLTNRRWPLLKGFSWWNERWQNDDNPAHDTTMRLQDNPQLAAVFRRYLAENPSVKGRISLENR